MLVRVRAPPADSARGAQDLSVNKDLRTALKRRGSARTMAPSGDPAFGRAWQEQAYAVPPMVKALPLLRKEYAL